MEGPPIDHTPRVPRDITKARIDNFMLKGSIFYEMGIHYGLWTHRHHGPPHVTLSVYSVPDLKRIPFKDAVTQTFEQVGQHDRKYGPSWATHWFKVHIVIPESLDGQKAVFQWDMGCEGLIWSKDGEPIQSLTGGSDQQRHEYILTDKAKSGDKFTFYIEAACNGMFGVGDAAMVPDPDRYFSIKTADLVVPNAPVQDLYYDLEIIRGIAYDTNPDTPRAREALWTVNQVINLFKLGDPKSIQQCKDITSEFLSIKNGSAKGQHQISAVGNCHIDTAWLWPYDETKRKIARSWVTQVDLMDRYPEYIFTGSQTQQYEWLRELYPTVFERIKEKEKAGQWEIIGGSWVEHGKYTCKKEIYNPATVDGINAVFRYKHAMWRITLSTDAAWLPQVLKLSGCDYFFTQKLSWNNINKFPLSTFYWVGIDGTRILAHLTPADTYNASVTVAELNKCATKHHDLEYSNESLLCFGHGDGGGGPTPEMLERLRRVNDVDGLPICKPSSALQFFERIAVNDRGLQEYNGELYLEFHRGTYTSQALVKQGNRKSEFLVRDVEILGVIATLLARSLGKTSSYSYPVNELDHMWKLLCLNQFHDCLPGSAIGLAYKDVHKHHREIISDALSLRHKAQTAIMQMQSETTCRESQEGMVVFNTLPWTRAEVVTVPAKGTSWVGQQWTANGHEYVIVRDVPGLGAAGYVAHSQSFIPMPNDEGAKAYKNADGTFVLENVNLKATFNGDGQLVQLIDKKTPERKPLVPENRVGNLLQLYEDVPIYWDAWDVEIYHLQKWKAVKGSGNLKVVSKGPIKAELQFSQKISDKSWIDQTISITCIGERIEFNNHVTWHESHQFLKVEFPWNLVSDHATYEIAYGALRRPTHYNSTIDSAKFEVCGHKFADLSESNYGVALLNNCKYGYATHGNTQRLSLLRSPKGPDENADMGEHKFKYAIYPHKHHFNGSNVVREAIEFNVPLSFRYAKDDELKGGCMLDSLFRVDPPSQVILDTIKTAEDDHGEGNTLILRLYEAYGGQACVKLTSCLNIKHLTITNVLEDDLKEEIKPNADKSYTLCLHPFQILNLKVSIA
ncbi:hypothetical protein LRAMOSA06239 [Lichtheimia ramosa]|uniref:Alpha-mannosidase n=1 Tax=Lichtheimia ramosa TaxID=688394 RepID=A0A077X467_9FUNG|nr:hypothetical protein LRAMOSA06239 [Lichtheimia ramosa]